MPGRPHDDSMPGAADRVSGPFAGVVAACVVAACVVAAGRTVASICSVAPGPVPYVAPIDGALSGKASASSCRSGSWTIVPGLSACWPSWRGPLLFPAVFVPADAAGAWMLTVSTRPTRLGGQSGSGPGVPR